MSARDRGAVVEWLRQAFELSRGARDNLLPMEGLRGFAVGLVFFVHYFALIRPWLASDSSAYALAEALAHMGHTGVDLFFVLSGYLIYGSLISRPQPFARFFARRLERIYPAFIAVFVLYVVLSFLFPSESKLPASLLGGSLYLMANALLLPGLFPIPAMITVAWSLSYEMAYYVIMPIVVGIANLRAWRPRGRVILFASAAVLGSVYCAAFSGHIRLIMFVSGIVLYEALKNGRSKAPGSLVAFVSLAIGLSAMLVPTQTSLGYTAKIDTLFVAFFVLCHACFGRPTSTAARLFSWTPLRWLGNMSYSYYLIHGLALKAGFLALGLVFPPAGASSVLFFVLLPVTFVLTLLPSGALFLLVERPLSLKPSREAVRPAAVSSPAFP